MGKRQSATMEMHKFPGGSATQQQLDEGMVITWQPTAGSPSVHSVPREREADPWDWFREDVLPRLLGQR